MSNIAKKKKQEHEPQNKKILRYRGKEKRMYGSESDRSYFLKLPCYLKNKIVIASDARWI